MARLSGYLSSQMANPAYGGMLSKSVSGGMQGIQDQLEKKRQYQRIEMMQGMLSNNDPSDPAVVSQVQDYARQMGGDPMQAQAMIQNAQVQKRREQEMKDRQASAERQKVLFGQAQESKKREEGIRKAVEAAIKVHNTDPSKVDDMKKAMSAEQQAAVNVAIVNHERFKEGMIELKRQQAARAPYSEEQLTQIAAMPGMTESVEMYKKQQHEPGAKAALMQQYSAAHAAELRRQAKEDRPITDGERKAMTKVLDDMNLTGGFWGEVKEFFGADGMDENLKPLLADKMVEMQRKGVPLTLESIAAAYNEIEASMTGIPEDTDDTGIPVVGSQAAYDDLEKGAQYRQTEGGQVFTK